jgi:hypothetical protein
MDAAYKNPTRKFPAYTTAQLEQTIAMYENGTHPIPYNAAHVAALKAEVANRKSGDSKPFVVPQL